MVKIIKKNGDYFFITEFLIKFYQNLESYNKELPKIKAITEQI